MRSSGGKATSPPCWGGSPRKKWRNDQGPAWRRDAAMNAGSCKHKVLRRSMLASLAVLLLAGCSSAVSARAELIRPVKTMVVAAGDEVHVRSFPGKAEASRQAELAFQVSGVLMQFPVKEGQRVAKGEVIGQLRTDE